MRKLMLGMAAAVVAALVPGAAGAAFTLTLESAPAGFTGPTTATTTAAAPDSITYAFGDLTGPGGRIVVASSREQFPTFASIGTTYQIKAGTSIPTGTYRFRIRNDEFTLPPGTQGNIGVIHTSIIPFASAPGTPLVTTTATSRLPQNGQEVSVNGSPMLTQMFERLTPKPDGVYTLDQIVTINLTAGGSGQFSVTSYISAIPAPPALALGVIGLPLLALGRRLTRKKAAPAAV